MRIEMIGSPISHVRTPALLNQLFCRDRQNFRVVKKRLGPRALDRHVQALREGGGVIGLVVTTPLKGAVCDHLDRRTPLVELVGAANCVRFDGGSWIGANFDGFGFLAALAEAGVDLAGKNVLLAGCGGAGKPIAAQVVGARAASLALEDTEAGRATAFAQRLRRIARGCDVTVGAAGGRTYEILVNATPLGMRRGDLSPFRPEIVARSEVVIDIVISEFGSRLRRDARKFGKLFVGGTAMVRGQVDLLRRFLTTGASSETAVARAADKATRRRGAG